MFQQVTLTSDTPVILKPLVESAIQSELKMLAIGLRRTEHNLRTFEDRYRLNSEEFYRRFAGGELAENLDFIEWAGEVKTYRLLQGNYDTLKGVRVC